MAVVKILRLAPLRALVGKSTSTIYEEMAAGDFPKPIRLGRKAVGWLEDEIEDWQRTKIADRDAVGLTRKKRSI